MNNNDQVSNLRIAVKDLLRHRNAAGNVPGPAVQKRFNSSLNALTYSPRKEALQSLIEHLDEIASILRPDLTGHTTMPNELVDFHVCELMAAFLGIHQDKQDEEDEW